MIEILGKKYINQKEAAQKFGFSTSWFELQRHLKKPPKYIKLQGKILYELEKVTEWFAKQLIEQDY